MGSSREELKAEIASLEQRHAEQRERQADNHREISALLKEFRELDRDSDQSISEFLDASGRLPTDWKTDYRGPLARARLELAKIDGSLYRRHVLVDTHLAESDQGKNFLEPASDVSRCFFIQGDFGPPCLSFEAVQRADDFSQVNEVGLVSVTFHQASPMPLWGVNLVRFGYPNEEAFMDSGLIGFEGIGFYEVVNSHWQDEIVAFNRRRFPETPDDLRLRHFHVACKENTFEVLASGFRVDRVVPGSWDEGGPALLGCVVKVDLCKRPELPRKPLRVSARSSPCRRCLEFAEGW